MIGSSQRSDASNSSHLLKSSPKNMILNHMTVIEQTEVGIVPARSEKPCVGRSLPPKSLGDS